MAAGGCEGLDSSGEGGLVVVETWVVVNECRVEKVYAWTYIWAQGALWVLIHSWRAMRRCWDILCQRSTAHMDG